MLLLQDSFLQVPLQNAMALYSNEIVPRMTRKNQVISISVAVAMSLIYYINDRFLKPPRELRHIPYVSYFSTIKSLMKNETHWDRAHKVHLPLINKGTSLFIELGITGWELQVTNPVDAKRVLLKHDIFAKADMLEIKGTLNFRYSGGPNILLTNGAQWKRQRMISSPAFRRSLPVKLFGNLTQDMFKAIDGINNETVNISDLLERWTLDVIGKAGFGFDFHAITNQYNEWVKRYNAIQVGLRNFIFLLYPKLDNEFIWMFPERQKVHKELDLFLEMMDDVIHNKKLAMMGANSTLDPTEDSERNLLDLMMEGGENGEGVMTDEELKSNLCIFFAAGHDTTANSLAYAVHYLAENPEAQQKAREEAIQILGDAPMDVLPTIEDTKRMTYINMVIKETLRINGPAVRISTRITNQDTELSGTFVPKGTQLTVNIFDIQHTEEHWKDASIFNPERFSDDGGSSDAWLPFGNGARMCIGMNFSLCEQRVMLSMLLRKYSWSTPTDSLHKNGLVTAGYGVVGPINLDMNFKKRY